MIVLDTNALIWWIGDPDKLSKNARKSIEQAKKDKLIFISSITVLEIYTLMKKSRLGLDRLPDSWLNEIQSLSSVRFVPVDNMIAKASVELDGLDNKDPADRIIIATALDLGAKLVTSDKKIRDYKKVQTIW